MTLNATFLKYNSYCGRIESVCLLKMEEANVSASLSVPKSVADSDIPEVQEVPASDATLSATRRIGGQRGHCTKLMQQVLLIVNEKEFHRAREVADLKNQLDRSHEGYTTSVEEFCKPLDQDSPRYQEYMLQLNARTVELVDLRARVAEFMLEGIEERSAIASNKSRGTVRSRKEILSGCGGTVKSNSTVSSASKLRLEVKLAEMRLQQAESAARLQLQQAESAARLQSQQMVQQAESAARLQSQQMVLQAETALLEARIRAEVMEEQVFEEPADVQPELHDKVDDYLQSLPPSGPPPLECRSPAFLQMAHSTPDALAHDLPSHSEVNSSLSFPPPVIPVSSPGDSNPGASNLNVQAESWQPQSSKALGVKTQASHGPAIADSGKPPVCPSEPSFLPKPVFPRCSVQCSAPFNPQLPAFFGDNAQSGHVSVPIATNPQPQVTSSIPAFCTIYPQTNTMFGAATCTTTVYPNNLVPHGPATSSAEQSPLQVSGHLATDPKWLYTQPRPASGIINPAASGSGYNFENKCKAPCLPSKPDPDKSSINDFARVLVRCQSSRALTEEERYSGDPLRYHQFIRQVEDCILSIHGQSDPGHALQLLLDSTTGRARKLIRSCIMLRPAEALNKALQLLYKAFGCPAVAIKAHLKLVCEGPVIHTDEQSL